MPIYIETPKQKRTAYVYAGDDYITTSDWIIYIYGFNDSTADQSYDFEFYVDGHLASSGSRTIKAGQTDSASFQMTPSASSHTIKAVVKIPNTSYQDSASISFSKESSNNWKRYVKTKSSLDTSDSTQPEYILSKYFGISSSQMSVVQDNNPYSLYAVEVRVNVPAYRAAVIQASSVPWDSIAFMIKFIGTTDGIKAGNLWIGYKNVPLVPVGYDTWALISGYAESIIIRNTMGSQKTYAFRVCMIALHPNQTY